MGGRGVGKRYRGERGGVRGGTEEGGGGGGVLRGGGDTEGGTEGAQKEKKLVEKYTKCCLLVPTTCQLCHAHMKKKNARLSLSS